MTIVAAAALCAAAPATAVALTWSQGGATSFTGTQKGLELLTGADGKYSLVLPLRALGTPLIEPGSGVLPSSAEPLPDGRLLISDTNARRVVLYDANRNVVWTFSATDDPTLVEPTFAQRTKNNTTLVVDRISHQVIEFDDDKNVVWRYGAANTPSDGTLSQPYSAEMTDSGTILISDPGMHRVIEVSKVGTDQGTLVWQYGDLGAKAGAKIGFVRFPTSAERLDENHTLITDRDSHRVIEVTNTKKVVWSFGTTDVSGSTPTQLKFPRSAWRHSDGSTLIADTKNLRVLRVGATGTQVLPGSFLSPLTARIGPDGRVVVADSETDSLTGYGYGSSGTFDTGSLNLNAPGFRKRVSKISVSASQPGDTKATMEYSFDGGKFKTAKGLSVTWSGKGRQCTYLRVRVRLAGDGGARTSVLKTVSVKYDLVTSNVAGTTGAGTGTGGTGAGLGVGATGGSPLGSQTATMPVAKSGGASTALPSGTAVELQGVNTLHSGHVMDQVSSEMPGAGASVNKPALDVDPIGVATAGILLGTFYTLGLAGPQLSQAASGAWSAVRQMTIGRMHG